MNVSHTLFPQALLQLSLAEKDPFEFVSHADDFVKGLEERLLEGDEFSKVEVVILGAVERDSGIS